jgi:hypothetical protein
MADPGTVSLVIRGPAVTSAFQILDLKTGQPRTRVGAAEQAGPQEEGEARIPAPRLREIETYLAQHGLI